MNNDNEMDWSEEETTYDENFELENYKVEKIAATYDELKVSGKNIVEKYFVPLSSIASQKREVAELKRKALIKKRADYILNNCEKFGFNQTNKIILENAIDEFNKPKSTKKSINLRESLESRKYDWISQGLGLAAGDAFILVGEAFCGKTHLATYLALCVATNTPIFGKFEINKPGDVAHLNYDSANDLTEVGYIRMANGLIAENKDTDIDKYKVEYEKPLWRFNQDIAYEELTKTCTGKSLCVIDSLRRCYGGGEIDENSSESGEVVNLANRVSAETGCAIIFIAHPGKGGTKGKGIDSIRGTSASKDAAGSLWILEKTSIDQVIKFDSTHKSRYGSKQVFH